MAFAPAAEEIRNTSVTRRRGNWSDCGRQIWVSRAISAYLASLVGLVGASPISSQGLAFVRQIMRQILPLAARSTISLNIWQHESGPAEFCANVCFELEEFSLQEKLPESKTKVRFQYSSSLSEGQPYLLFLALKRQFMKFSWNVGLQR